MRTSSAFDNLESLETSRVETTVTRRPLISGIYIAEYTGRKDLDK